MSNRDNKYAEIGFANQLDEDIMLAYDDLSRSLNVAPKHERKISYAGANDIILLLSSPEVWQDLTPWALLFAQGATKGAGSFTIQRLLNGLFKSQTDKKLDIISELQKSQGEKLERLIALASENEQLREGEFSLGLKTGGALDSRDDFAIRLESITLEAAAAAVLVLSVLSSTVQKICDHYQVSGEAPEFDGAKTVRGSAHVTEEGVAIANLVFNVEAVKDELKTLWVEVYCAPGDHPRAISYRQLTSIDREPCDLPEFVRLALEG